MTAEGFGSLGPGPAGDARDLRRMLALALDFDDSVLAMRWATRLKEFFGVAKVGLELFSAAGPSVVAELLEAGFKVFMDMKLADIPNTTRKAARVLGALGASYLTIHTFAGVGALEAGVEGFAEGAERAGLPAPVALGVSVLTSDAGPTEELLRSRVRAALDAGCGGVVCAGGDVPIAKSVAPGLIAVVPGIRLAGAGANDHRGRATTPGEAVRAGADLLVIGRAVTDAEEPEGAALAVLAELGAVLRP